MTAGQIEERLIEDGVRFEEPDAVPADSYRLPLPGRIHHLTRAMNTIGTLWIVGLMVLVNADVIGRNVLAAPVRGTTELVALSIVGIVFLQLPDTLHAGGFTRATVLVDSLQAGRPRIAALLHSIHHLIGAAFMLIILWAAWEPLMESIRIREYVGAIGDFTVPVWPVRLIMLAGLAATAVVFMLLMFADLRRMALLQRRQARHEAGRAA